jgi:hypothetical protein
MLLTQSKIPALPDILIPTYTHQNEAEMLHPYQQKTEYSLHLLDTNSAAPRARQT